MVLVAIAAVWITTDFLIAPAPQIVGNLPNDLPGKSVQFSSESGSTVRGWFIPGKPGGGAVALMHGVSSNRLSMLDRARFLSHAGYTVLLFDFQAHGESTGNHITFGALESKDAQAAIHFLRENALAQTTDTQHSKNQNDYMTVQVTQKSFGLSTMSPMSICIMLRRLNMSSASLSSWVSI